MRSLKARLGGWCGVPTIVMLLTTLPVSMSAEGEVVTWLRPELVVKRHQCSAGRLLQAQPHQGFGRMMAQRNTSHRPPTSSMMLRYWRECIGATLALGSLQHVEPLGHVSVQLPGS